jgi:hypothetical protein
MRDGKPVTIYPAEYQAWLSQSDKEGALNYSSMALRIVSPHDGFVFLQSTSDSDFLSTIPVEVQGGKEDRLQVFYDGKVMEVARPFFFHLPETAGEHSLTVRCGNESASLRFSVQ